MFFLIFRLIDSNIILFRTVCGTPNYIAPEILNNLGHSFEVDMWSIGCILYTLLVGKPPFETKTLEDTYKRIKDCNYTIPSQFPRAAENLIVWLLQIDPSKRPNVTQCLEHEWFSGWTPTSLPPSVLISAPRFTNVEDSKITKGATRKPLIEVNSGN